jgi:hypothetical protein
MKQFGWRGGEMALKDETKKKVGPGLGGKKM